MQAAAEGSGDMVLRDYADPTKPRSVCTFGGQIWPVQLIDARHVVIGYFSNDVYAVVDLPEVRYHWFRAPGFVAVSPGLDEVLSLTTYGDVQSGVGGTQVHLTTSAGDQVIASLPHPIGGRCGSPEGDSNQGAYTRSGGHVFVLDQPISNYNSLMVLEGETTVLSDLAPSNGWTEDAHPMMAVWSPASEMLYYRQGGDVWTWTAGGEPELYLPGVSWSNPTITPDADHLAYSVARADGLHDVYLIDFAHDASPELIGEARSQPVFLNNTQLWFKSEVGMGCVTGPSEPLIYDLADSMEAPSVIEQVIRVWPATSSYH